MWAVYAGTGRKRVAQVMELIVKEMRELADNMTEIELERAKAQLKGNLILGLESTSSRMQNIARQEIYYGRYYSPSELIKDINAVDLKRVKELSKRLIVPKTPSLSQSSAP